MSWRLAGLYKGACCGLIRATNHPPNPVETMCLAAYQHDCYAGLIAGQLKGQVVPRYYLGWKRHTLAAWVHIPNPCCCHQHTTSSQGSLTPQAHPPAPRPPKHPPNAPPSKHCHRLAGTHSTRRRVRLARAGRSGPSALLQARKS